MANSQTDFNQIYRLSSLPDELLVTILSFLPTHIAARTSVLCRRFRYLWEASPSLVLISRDLPNPQSDNFIAVAKRALLCRNPSHPLLSLHLEVSRCHRNDSFISSLLTKARSLDLHHLTMEDSWFSSCLTMLPIIFTINSLRCLSLDGFPDLPLIEFNFPSGITLTCLRSLSLRLARADPAKLNRLLSELCSLEDLHLDLKAPPGVILSSQSIRKLQLSIAFSFEKHDNVLLSLPSLESLHLETRRSFQCLSHIHGEIPLLRKAVINLRDLFEEDASTVAGMLNWISHVEELSLHIKESLAVMYPIPILLESGKDVPKFSNLKHLDVTLCFHEHNFEAVITMLRNCPVLRSLKLVHEIPKLTGRAKGRKKKDWGSRLPRNADGNYRYAYFRNLHLGEDSKEFMKLLSKKSTSKRQACN